MDIRRRIAGALKGESGSGTGRSEHVEAIAEKYGITYNEAKEKIEEVRKQFPDVSISNKTYVINKLDEYTGEELEAAVQKIVRRRENENIRIGEIMMHTGLTADAARAKMRAAKKKFEISSQTYIQRKYYLFTDEEIQKDIERRAAGVVPLEINESKAAKNKRKNKYVKYIAQKHGITYNEAKEKMDAVREKYPDYNITYATYVSNKIDEVPEESLEKKVKAIARRKINTAKKRIQSIMDVTGWTEEETNKRLAEVKEKFKLGPKTFYGRMYYKMTDEEIEQDMINRTATNEAHLQHIIDESGKSREEIKKHMFYVNCKYSIDAHDYLLLRCWECDDELLDTYANIKISRAFPVKYNDPSKNQITANKILFNQYFKDYTNRKYWVNADTTFEEFQKFTDGLEYIFIKAIDLCQARGTRKIMLSEVKDLRALYDELMAEPKTLVEEGVIQCKEMSDVYPESINTCRVVSLQIGEEVHTLAAFVRFGLNGSIVDNMVAGGTIGGVDEKTGIIDAPLVDRDGNVYEVHPNSGKRVLGMQIPMWDEVLRMTERAVKHVDGLNYIGWDVAFTDNGPILIEANTMPGLTSLQIPYAQLKKGTMDKFLPYL